MKKMISDEKMEEIRNRHKDKKESKKGLPRGMKKCPFQSTPEEDVPCTPDCMLYRSSKQAGWNCPFQELPVISWNLSGRSKK